MDSQSTFSSTGVPMQPTIPSEALETHCNGTLSPKMSPTTASSSSLTPANLRTLKKLLDDAQSPTRVKAQEDGSRQRVDITNDDSTNTGIEDEVHCTHKQLAHGDELEVGYEDEDASMELSNSGAEDDEAEGIVDQSSFLDDEGREYVWSDGDTIEDIMNTPGKTASPPRPHHLGRLYSQIPKTPNDIDQRRATLEGTLRHERVVQELREALFTDEAIVSEGRDDAVYLSDDSDFQAIQDVQARTGLAMIEEGDEAEADSEYFELQGRRASRRFFPAPIARRASEDSLPVASFQAKPDHRPAVVATPSGHHLDFTPSSSIPATPFTKTLQFFKNYSGKENSPIKNRRNASLPEEIAEVAREARDEEEEDLEQYREMDLAPLEPVMESQNAGDLITFGTPVRSNILAPLLSSPSLSKSVHHAIAISGPRDYNESTVLPSLSTMSDTSSPEQSMDIKGKMGVPEISSGSPLVRGQQDNAVDAYLDATSVNSSKDPNQDGPPQEPTFVKVIGLLPEALFWTAAAPVARYSAMAYEALVEKFAIRDM
ncbi:hypothetical protein ACEQ8H_008341 [Pleosporales sp. CAS-2024a]